VAINQSKLDTQLLKQPKLKKTVKIFSIPTSLIDHTYILGLLLLPKQKV